MSDADERNLQVRRGSVGAPGRIRTCDTRFRNRSCGSCMAVDVHLQQRCSARRWLYGQAEVAVRSTSGSTPGFPMWLFASDLARG